MSRFNCRTRGTLPPMGKPNVYFCCHPADVSCFDEIAGDILRFQNCAIGTGRIRPDRRISLRIPARQIRIHTFAI